MPKMLTFTVFNMASRGHLSKSKYSLLKKISPLVPSVSYTEDVKEPKSKCILCILGNIDLL